MRITQSGIELIGNVGWGVIKNSGRCLYGGGQAIVGMVGEDEELIGDGVKNISGGAMGLAFQVTRNLLGGDSNEAENVGIDTNYDV